MQTNPTTRRMVSCETSRTLICQYNPDTSHESAVQFTGLVLGRQKEGPYVDTSISGLVNLFLQTARSGYLCVGVCVKQAKRLQSLSHCSSLNRGEHQHLKG